MGERRGSRRDGILAWCEADEEGGCADVGAEGALGCLLERGLWGGVK